MSIHPDTLPAGIPDEIPPTVSLSSAGLRLALASLQTRIHELNDLVQAASEALFAPDGLLFPQSDALAETAKRLIPRWHFAMLNDAERNEALVTALERRVPAGSLVLDIGTGGTGLLAMAAIRAGASRVYACEENPLLAELARQVIARHGMADVITVLDRTSTRLRIGRDIERRVDMIVSEIVDCGLIGEGLLPTVRHAREHLLAPGGLMMPTGARLFGRLVQSEAVVRLNRVHDAAGFDVSLMNLVATRGHFPVRLGTWPHRTLSEPVELVRFDLENDPLLPGSRHVTVPATADGEAHAMVAWFELELGADRVLRNSPEETGSHWMQALLLFEKPVSVSAGDRLGVELRWTDRHLTVTDPAQEIR